MTTTSFRRAPVAAALTAASLALAAGQVQGAGFALQEQNASGLGHAYAGGAAAAEDVSTIFYNPAGLVRLQSMQVVVAANVICPSTKFHDSASEHAFNQPLGGTGGDAGSCAGVPNLYIGVPFTDKWSFGLGVNVPYGLKTEYDSSWLGRFQAVESKVETYNINPVLSWESPSKAWTIGGGVSYQHLKATLTSQVNYAYAYAGGVQQAVAGNPSLAPFASTLIASAAQLESSAHVTGDDGGWGWNLGVLWQATPQTRIGAAYRSHISYTVVGDANFDNPSAVGTLPAAIAPAGAAILNGLNTNVLYDGSVKLNLKTPDTANLSIFHQFNNQWDLMADLQYTGWSSIKELNIVRTSGPLSDTTLQNTDESFRSTWRVSAGANYRYNNNWIFRGGLAWDQSPVRDEHRTPRLPDNDRTWLALGAQYKFNDNWALDAAYAYIWIKDASMNQNAGNTQQYGLINGNYKANVNIVGLQVTYTAK